MRKSIVMLVGVCCLPVVCLAAWKVERSVDEMTDCFAYYVYATGRDVRLGEVFVERPAICVKVEPLGLDAAGRLHYKGGVLLTLDHERFRRGENEIVLRHDKRPAKTERWESSRERRSVFAPDWRGMVGELMGVTNLAVRYETSLGKVRTTVFEVGGLKAGLEEVKSDYAKSKNLHPADLNL